MTSPVAVERRIGHRFTLNLPVALCEVKAGTEGLGFTQNLSSRGAFLFASMRLGEGDEVELTLQMPSEITLGESMQVRCRGRVLRIVHPAEFDDGKSAEVNSVDKKIGVAVCFQEYEYLAENQDVSAEFRRISALHESRVGAQPAVSSAVATRTAAD
jgi:PilZ domain-containing protein